MLRSALRSLRATAPSRRALSSSSTLVGPGTSTPSPSSLALRDQGVAVTWSDGAQSSFHYIWLRDNAAEGKEASSQQKMRSILDLDLNVRARSARLDGNDVVVTWTDGGESRYASAWLRANRYDERALREGRDRMRPKLWRGNDFELPVLGYEEICADEKGVWRWCQALASNGVVKVTGVPRTRDAFVSLVGKLGHLKRNMYGDVFDVVSVPDPINVAYTALELPPHMDLCYYEAVPGLQFLHALTFPPQVSGGLSTFYDGFRIAEDFREQDPFAFSLLASEPMTFFKEDSGHHQLYRRPLIVLDPQGDLVSLNYSPPWEAPLRISSDLVLPYYAAYQTYTRLVNDPKYRVAFRLKEGELVSFNNRRIFHGRTQFGNEGHRHLQGCYVDTDDFSNTWRVLKRKYDPDNEALLFPRMGNYSS